MFRIARILDTASVRIEVDVSEGERDARRAGESYGREYAKGADKQTRQNPAKIKVDPLTADFERQVRSEVNKIARTVNANIPLTIEGEKLRAKVAVAIAEIERTLSAKIPTNPADATEYRRKLALLAREAAESAEAKVPLRVDIDRDRNIFGRAAASLGRIFKNAFTSESSGTFAGLLSSSGGAFSKIGGYISDMASSASSSFSQMSGGVLTFLKVLAGVQIIIPAIAAGITLLGGTAVAAFGAISAGVLGLPALLTGIIAPIAAITLGMDGIKRAAAPLSDEIKHLTDVLNVTFELNMRPVFERLQAIFPTLSVGLAETARGVSRVAMDLTDVLTSKAGIEDLRSAFFGVSEMIDQSRDGLKNLFSALLNVAGTKDLYTILGETIGGVAARFGDMIERVRSSGDLAAGLGALRDVLLGMVDLLNILIEGSIKFFAAAGPGLTSFFASLTEVLSRIDWVGLGKSFGDMMTRLGDAVEAIPPEKWQELADAIGGLSEKFIQMVQDGSLLSLVEGIASLGNALLTLSQGIDAVEGGLNGLSDTVNGWGMAIYNNVTSPVIHAVEDLFEYLGIASPAQKLIDIGIAIVEGLLVGLAGGPAAVFNKMREIAGSVLSALSDAPGWLVSKGHEWVEGAKRGISDKLGEIKARASEIKNNVVEALSDAKDWLFGTGVDVVMGFIRGIGSKIGEAARAAWDMAKAAWNAAKSAISSGSPSKLFMSLGVDTVQGYIIGLKKQIAPLLAQIRELFALAVSEATDASAGGFDLAAGFNLAGGAVNAAVGAAAGGDIAGELAAAFSGMQLTARFDGPNVVTLVNDENRRLAKR